ncbi:MAG: acyltransferase [Bifidobacteriaceae bacterium]|jgi:peptidoglycan/LPS O-acetylase OafA/YrhL|nr:acyltransferase [Bifidobacteriaceae bacterium]
MINSKNYNKGFRADIQALRALAVVSVIAFHSFPTLIGGGFVGVDIFFVISGYLITLHLVSQLEKGVRFREFLYSFYAKRIKRLAPASALVLLFVCIVVSLYSNHCALLSSTFSQIIASVCLVQNWMLQFISVDYFSQGASSTAVMHFWSLSIEEQFYLIWPVLLFLCFLIYKSSKNEKKKLPAIILISLIIAASFVYSIVLTNQNPSLAYFSTFARMYQLSAGALLALLTGGKGAKIYESIFVKGAALCTGLALAFYSVFFIREANYPSFYSAFPTLAGVLIIFAGCKAATAKNKQIKNPQNISQKIWSKIVKCWIKIGDASYSLYLWHFPLLVLAPLALGVAKLSTIQEILTIVLIFAFGFLSYAFVEQPFRTKKFFKPNFRIYVTGAVCFLLVFLPTLYFEKSSFSASESLLETLHNKAYKAVDNYFSIDDKKSGEDNSLKCFGALALINEAECESAKDKRYVDSSFRLTGSLDSHINNNDKGESLDLIKGDCFAEGKCYIGDISSNNEWTLIGDSHAKMYIEPLNYLGKRFGFKVKVMVAPNCLLTRDKAFSNGYFATQDDSVAGCKAMYSYLDSSTKLYNKTIVDLYYTSSQYSNFVNESDSRVYIQNILQFFETRFPNSYFLTDTGNINGFTICTAKYICQNDLAPSEPKKVTNINNAFKQIIPEDRLIDLEKFWKMQNVYPYFIGGIPTRQDAGHLTQTYSITLAPALASALHL